MKPLTIINVTDVTDNFKIRLLNRKCQSYQENDIAHLHKEAMKNVTYLTNMYVYSCLAKFENRLIEYKLQSGEEIADNKIYFLN